MTQWVSFHELKQQVSMEDILRHYGMMEGLRQKGDELIGLCPFHEESKGSFYASTSKNAFHCFGCKKKGNILDFVAVKEGVTIREAAVLIQGWFNIASQNAIEAPQTAREAQNGTQAPSDQENSPLTFVLRNLDAKHPYLKERGVNKETVEHFGIGYCSRGLMKGRIAIPVHNEIGELVAYAGRYPGEPPEGDERYKLPQGFVKSRVVFNLHQAGEIGRDKGLIVVEGFFDVFRVSQAGYPNVVALMGSHLSPTQKELLVDSLGPQGKLTLLFDADDAGLACQAQCLEELSSQLFVKPVRLPEGGHQPDELTDEQILQLLAG